MRDRKLYLVLGLLGSLLLVGFGAPGVSQAPSGAGSGALYGPNMAPAPIHVHIHNNSQSDPYLYGYNPYGPRYDAMTEYRRQQLENFLLAIGEQIVRVLQPPLPQVTDIIF